MLISTFVDKNLCTKILSVWQYMLISTFVDFSNILSPTVSDSIC